jgi:hypothetical protein
LPGVYMWPSLGVAGVEFGEGCQGLLLAQIGGDLTRC